MVQDYIFIILLENGALFLLKSKFQKNPKKKLNDETSQIQILTYISYTTAQSFRNETLI